MHASFIGMGPASDYTPFTLNDGKALLANLVTDSFRAATKADIGFTANGMMRAGLSRGKTGVQTVCGVFAVAPLGSGVVYPASHPDNPVPCSGREHIDLLQLSQFTTH